MGDNSLQRRAKGERARGKGRRKNFSLHGIKPLRIKYGVYESPFPFPPLSHITHYPLPIFFITDWYTRILLFWVSSWI